MKKRSLTTAVLAGLVGVAGFAGTASAVSLNPDGTGQALIYPYYTVRAGQQTYISVVNSTDVAQSVKVRFLEGYASKEVLDFNLFLSAYDVWTGTIFKLSDIGASGAGAAIGTRDHSCTIPNIYQGAQAEYLPSADLYYKAFTNAFYTDGSSYSDDLGPAGTDRTNEGYIELIAMSSLGDANGTATAITHVPTADAAGLPVAGSGMPVSCNFALLDNLANTDLTTTAPAGGLFGNAAIVNTTNGTYYAYAADAIEGFTETELFTLSGSLEPNLTFANSDPLGNATAYVVNGSTMVSATFPASNAIDAVSAVFMASSIMNEWIADASSGMGTDWVVTFPTKRYYVNDVTTAAAPFTEAFDSVHEGAACERVGLDIRDREEGTPGSLPGGPVFSPAPVIQTVYPNLCHEVNVVTISDPEDPISILGSQYVNGLGGMGLAVNIPPYGSDGWLTIDFTAGSGHELTTPGGLVFNGLPATGFAAQRLTVDTGGSILANYSGAFHHRVERSITSAAPTP